MTYQLEVEDLVSDRQKFNDLVYTPLENIHTELEKRRADKSLSEKVSNELNGDIPPFLIEGKAKAVIFRQITTPNYEVRRFLQILDAIEGLDPLFGEYRDDIFFAINEEKKYWGKIGYFQGFNKTTLYSKIIDFKNSDGRRLSELRTTWGQPLIDFHHELFEKTYRPISPSAFCNISEWLSHHGKTAKNYYRPVLAWFLQHAVLFENLTLNDPRELAFTKEVFLPAFIQLFEETGYRPIIINLLPTDIEHKEFWYCHPETTRKYVEKALLSSDIVKAS